MITWQKLKVGWNGWNLLSQWQPMQKMAMIHVAVSVCAPAKRASLSAITIDCKIKHCKTYSCSVGIYCSLSLALSPSLCWFELFSAVSRQSFGATHPSGKDCLKGSGRSDPSCKGQNCWNSTQTDSMTETIAYCDSQSKTRCNINSFIMMCCARTLLVHTGIVKKHEEPSRANACAD